MSETEYVAYPCAGPACVEYVSPENLRYWPDSGAGAPGWYCPDCLAVLITDLLQALPSLAALHSGNFSTWPSTPVVLGIPDARLLPKPHCQCHQCQQWKMVDQMAASIYENKWFCRKGCDT